MTTDFSYGGKQIISGGPFKPSGKDMPIDARTRVERYADIANIPNPHIGLKITVKSDETNNSKMTDYIVKSLKANSFGVANSLVDEVVRYVDYLGATSGGGSSSGGASVEIVNDLTTGGANKALSAEQGKVIKSSLDNITTRVDRLELGGNLVLRDILEGEIFTVSSSAPPITSYGNIVISKSSITIVEGGTDTFTIKLDKAPSQNQQVSLSVNNSSVSLSKTIFNFTSSNFNIEQSVTITILEDDNTNNEVAILTASSSNVSSKLLTINITDNDETPSEVVNVQSVTLNKPTHTMKVDETLQLTPVITPPNATNQEVNWEASNSNCIVVGGLVTAKVQGECIISCKTVDGNKTDTCTVTVQAKDVAPSSLPTNGLISHYDMTKELSNGKIKDLYGGLDITIDTTYVSYGNGYITTLDGGSQSNYMSSAIAPSNAITNAYSVILTITTGSQGVYPICSTGTIAKSQLLVYYGGLINYNGAFNQSQTATQISNNTKYTIALTHSVDGNDTFYINGVKKYSEVTKVNSIGNQLKLFADYGAKHSGLKIHNLALYDRILSDEEIATVTSNLGGV